MVKGTWVVGVRIGDRWITKTYKYASEAEKEWGLKKRQLKEMLRGRYHKAQEYIKVERIIIKDETPKVLQEEKIDKKCDQLINSLNKLKCRDTLDKILVKLNEIQI